MSNLFHPYQNVSQDQLRVFTFEGDRGIQQRDDGGECGALVSELAAVVSFVRRKEQNSYHSSIVLKGSPFAFSTGATAELQIDTEKHMDGRAMREKVLMTASERAEGFEDDKKYRGMHSYIDYRAGFRKEHSIASEKGGGAHGPMRASSNVRMTFIMDYKPDICKDYKETGYCGYGDACKFLHDRGDYKQGWQLDKEWELKEKLKKEAKIKLEQMERGLGEDGEELDADDDEVRVWFACLYGYFP